MVGLQENVRKDRHKFKVPRCAETRLPPNSAEAG